MNTISRFHDGTGLGMEGYRHSFMGGHPLGGMSAGGMHKNSLVGDMAKAVGGVVKRRKHVVLLGLDGSGKTTILLRLKYGCYIATAPTIGFNHEKVSYLFIFLSCIKNHHT